ncbi:pre-mRNA-splicing factor RBM22/SLT11, partial [Phenoliferia sp. Uapishka_3]
PKDANSAVLSPLALPSSPSSVPFRPVRSQQPSVNTVASPRFVATRPSHQRSVDGGSIAFGAVRNNGLGTASHFHPAAPSSPGRSRTLPPTPTLAGAVSPTLAQVPYEIPALTKESAPFNVYEPHHPDSDSDNEDFKSRHTKPAGAVGLGVRPGAAPTALPSDRKFAGSSLPPPSTPPHERARSASTSPSSALSPSRRGIKGPRPPTDSDAAADAERREDEAAEGRRILRRQASTKTVTWAETEEVLEFEVEEERRRSSAASDLSRSTCSSSSGSSDGDRSYDSEEASIGFEEGGSVEVHDLDYDSEPESAVSSGSTVEDLVDTIDSFIAEDSFRADEDVFGGQRLDYGGEGSHPALAHRGITSAPMSAFSNSSASNASSSATQDTDTDGGATSDSSYDDEEELAQATKAHTALDAVEQTFDITPTSSPPTSPLTAPGLLPSISLDSNYSLPELAENSPFLGFDDDGAASSVVTMDLNRPSQAATTEPLASSAHTQSLSTPFQSTPTSLRTAPVPLSGGSTIHPTSDFSPMRSSFATSSPSPRLSREVSISSSDASGTYRTTGRLAANREAFEEKIRRSAALLESIDSAPVLPTFTLVSSPQETDVSTMTPNLSLESFPNPPIPLKGLSIPSSSKAIPARPALRLGGSGLKPSDSASAKLGMESPLERLSREVSVGEAEEQWKLKQSGSTGSLDSQASSESATERREKEIIERKRSLKAGGPGKKGRRSMSTGDMPPLRSTEEEDMSMERRDTMPELGMLYNPLEPIVMAGPSFSSGAESSLDDVYRQRNSSYRVRESKMMVYANDGEVTTVGAAGDVDPGRAWRKKRPSDMNISSLGSMGSIATAKSAAKPGNKTFVKIVEFIFEKHAFPTPTTTTTIECFVRQEPQVAVKVGSFHLATTIPMNKEFEVSKTTPLDIILRIPITSDINRHLLPAAPPPRVLPPPKSPSRNILSVFSSPKKKKSSYTLHPTPVAVPDRITQYIAPDNVFARSQLNIAAQASRCCGKSVTIPLPISTDRNSSQKIATGSVVLEILSIPHLGNVTLPKSMDAVRVGMAAAEAESKPLLETVLTQLGGDCTFWRRRLFKLNGHRLVPYSEVTKKAMVEIDLTLASSIFDPSKPQLPLTPETAMTRSSSADLEEERYTAHEHTFSIIFIDGTDIQFFADSAEDKERWIAVLGTVVGKKARKPAPEVQDLHSPIHSLQVAPGSRNALQEDRDLSDLCKDKERLPGMLHFLPGGRWDCSRGWLGDDERKGRQREADADQASLLRTQTCLLDLQFGLPTQVRDTALGQRSQAPTSAINREYYAQNKEGKLEEGPSGALTYGKADSAGKELLKRLARNDPYYKRNRPHICSFYAKGACNRGDECPYRHELPVENEMSHQNIKDRYHGVNDPVARKILAGAAATSGLAPPPDTSITSLFLSSLPDSATEDLIRSFYLSTPSLAPTSLKSIVLVPTSKVAFVNFSDRKSAEIAAERSAVAGKVTIDGKEVKVQWGRSRPKKAVPATGELSVVAERELASSGK